MAAGGTSEPSPKGVLPQRLEPMLAVPAPEPFDAPDRIFEVKWDGIRALAFISKGRARLQSRNLKEITGPFSDVAAELAYAIHSDGVVLDGELVSLDKKGLPHLPKVMQRIHEQGSLAPKPPVSYQIFDILYKDYRSLMREPLMQRKRLLSQTVGAAGAVQLCHFVEGEGTTFFQGATDLGLEGMVAKLKNSLYQPGKRSRSWLKVKATKTANLVVGGYTIGGGNRKEMFGSVLLGVHDRKGLRFLGSVGGGFAKDEMELTHKMLTQLQSEDCPFFNAPQVDRLLYWCRPLLVMQVKYGELTEAGHLRFPIFLALRPDIDPSACTVPALEGKY